MFLLSVEGSGEAGVLQVWSLAAGGALLLLYAIIPTRDPGYRRYLYVTGSCLREVSTQQKISNKRPLFCLQCEL